MSPSGGHWRCTIGPVNHFYRNHGALLCEREVSDNSDSTTTITRYSSGQENEYFGWTDSHSDTARSLAEKFIKQFPALANSGRGWDYRYAGWYERLLGLAEAGWLPVVLQDYGEVSFEHIPLLDVRPKGRSREQKESPELPLPPRGEFQQDYGA
jgi:hypothetical protein